MCQTGKVNKNEDMKTWPPVSVENVPQAKNHSVAEIIQVSCCCTPAG
jgi:hypothetical protein